MQARTLLTTVVGAIAFAFPTAAFAGHGLALLDHQAPAFAPSAPPSPAFAEGGPGAQWELVTSIPTGNPHTDVDFFTQGPETYASVGTLGTGPNGGGQTIVQLTQGGNVDPQFLSAQPSASCLSDPTATTGLQHDVEATPKGHAILNTENPYADRSDTQLILDATDAPGRCHDQGDFGLAGVPQGGLEIVDVTDPAAPHEIGLVSHIGESHTVNIDPKRPQIAYSVTSDSIQLNEDGSRQNEDPGDSDRFDLDGFEVVDLSSCMNFPAGTTLDQKRAACRPQVYRYRYSSSDVAVGHTLKRDIYACHELEVYPDDRLTCASGASLIGLDMSGAFNDMGTPTDFTDDKPNGTPLPCTVRDSSSAPPFTTGAKVTDCVDGTGGGVGGVSATEDLTVPGWLASGAPSIEGVHYIGTIHHTGRAGTGELAPFDSTEDIDFDHEAELSSSGNFLIATDERGGGILPPGATCSPGIDNPQGNGGVHFYKTDALHTGAPGTPEAEHQAYARTPEGDKAIFRVPIRTQPKATVCTAHVFHQIPGENRIVMAWYSQGTHVIDYFERPDGTLEFQEAGWFLPANTNEWSSAIFKSQRNADGTETYWGATGDFNLGEAGRNTIDIYKVTLPPAPRPGTGPGVGAGPTGAGGDGGGNGGSAAAGADCSNVIAGTRGGERLTGTNFGDTIRGKRGSDRIKAGLGDDCVFGGRGRDSAKGQQGDDSISGGQGRDAASGGPGDDRIRIRGGGRDRASCGGGNDVAVVDKRDRVGGCEKVKRKKK
jgi:hypothetical protein